MFSGVVSASAASVWSFYNKTADVVVEVKGTYEMEKGQFADFDLYKNDEIVDTDIYTVKYESSDADVVWVDAKNGKLRADKAGVAEVGDTATITAVIFNKETEVEAKRSFTIEIVEAAEVEYVITPNFGEEAFVVGEKYELDAVVTADGEEVDAEIVFSIDGVAIEGAYAPAKAGEVTIVATVVIDGEEYTAEFDCEAIDAAATEIVDAKQKDAKTVELTFDAKITAEEAAKIELYLGTVSKNNYKKAVKVKDNVVTFESYATFGNGKTWTFVYGDSKIDLKSSQGEVAKVVITGPEFFYLKSNGVNNARLKSSSIATMHLTLRLLCRAPLTLSGRLTIPLRKRKRGG
jgi:predicted Fe-Mo cluster-binding NifX family protein